MKTSSKSDSQGSNNFYLAIFALVLVATIATRFYKVTEPDHVW